MYFSAIISYRIILAVQMGAMMIGQITAFSPDYLKAKIAAARMFKIFDALPEIQSDSDKGLTCVSKMIDQHIPLYNDSCVLNFTCLGILSFLL